jgi:hypothetical protein
LSPRFPIFPPDLRHRPGPVDLHFMGQISRFAAFFGDIHRRACSRNLF